MYLLIATGVLIYILFGGGAERISPGYEVFIKTIAFVLWLLAALPLLYSVMTLKSP